MVGFERGIKRGDVGYVEKRWNHGSMCERSVGIKERERVGRKR